MADSVTIWPKDLYQKLEFDKILDRLESYCLGDAGKQAIASMPIHSEPEIIEILLLENQEYLRLQGYEQIPMGSYQSIDKTLPLLAIEDYVLSLEDLQKIGKNLQIVDALFRFFARQKEGPQLYPRLYRILLRIDYQPSLLKNIQTVLDEEGNVRPNASPELARLARLKQSKGHEIDKRFRQVLLSYQGRNMLADTAESYRNGRRVLAVPSEYKRQVRGILHDESATGRTVFIEPEELIDLNNDLFDIEQEERRELYRILKELSASLRPFCPQLRSYQEFLCHFDVLQAKSRLAEQLGATKPLLKTIPHLRLDGAYHPLLYLKNKELGEKVVPFSLEFHGPARILILSGPNAGGKSICMKTVGLLQLMLQAGILPSVAEGSEMGVFQEIFADIGDQQSIDDELSTYSSRLENAKRFVEHAGPKSLLLIDEFGSGTDPKMGGALAEAVLYELNKKSVYGVITTHYSNLKRFAHEQKGLLNASMVFDKENLAPTYQLQVGKPGSSYAFEIADKIGLQSHLVRYARKRIGRKEEQFEDMLIAVQRERQELQESQQKIKEQQQQLEQLIKNYEYAQRELEFGRKKLKLQQKEQELQESRQAQKDLHKLMRELRQAEDAQKAAERARAELRQEQRREEELNSKVDTIKDGIYENYLSQGKQAAIEVGCQVRLRDGQSVGTVKEIKRKEALVELDTLSLKIALRDLVRIENPLEIKRESTKIVRHNLDKQQAFDPKLDIRGMRYEEAIPLVEAFLDDALLANVDEVQIVHGKGTGALRKGVRKKIKEYRSVVDSYHPEAHKGGEGATVVLFQEKTNSSAEEDF